VRSTKRRHQSPEWTILSHSYHLIQLDSLHLSSTRTSSSSLRVKQLWYSWRLSRLAFSQCGRTEKDAVLWSSNGDQTSSLLLHMNVTSDNQMSFYDEVQMQVTTTVQICPPPLLHGHAHRVVKANGRSCHPWRFAPDCPTRQSHTASDRQRLAPSPNKHGPASYPTLCSQQGWGRGCWEVADWQQWKLEPVTLALSANGCTVLLKNEEVGRNCTISGSISCFSSTFRIYSPFIFLPGSANMRW